MRGAGIPKVIQDLRQSLRLRALQLRAAFAGAEVRASRVSDAEGLGGAPDRDVVAAATAAERIPVSLDRGLGDIRAYPPGSHAGIVVLRLTDQSAAAAIKAVSDLATVTDPDSLAGAVAVLQCGLLRIRHPKHVHGPHRAPSQSRSLMTRCATRSRLAATYIPAPLGLRRRQEV
jgi:Domain of unknown function (DUF5615)